MAPPPRHTTACSSTRTNAHTHTLPKDENRFSTEFGQQTAGRFQDTGVIVHYLHTDTHTYTSRTLPGSCCRLLVTRYTTPTNLHTRTETRNEHVTKRNFFYNTANRRPKKEALRPLLRCFSFFFYRFLFCFRGHRTPLLLICPFGAPGTHYGPREH